MIFAKPKLVLGLLFLASLAGCGSPGEPLPPSLELAEPVTDLHASRKGDQVTLTWTAPTRTTDGRNIRLRGYTEICRSVDAANPCTAILSRTPALKHPSSVQRSYAERLPEDTQTPTASYFYAVRVVNSYGRAAGPSNIVQVPGAPTLSAPENFQAVLSAEGVKLSWDAVPLPRDVNGLHFLYRIYRQETGSKTPEIAMDLPVTEEPPPNVVDHGFVWEHTYNYYATVVTIIPGAGGSQQVEGDNTPSVTVIAHDVFPPATPSGLQAVFSGPGQKRFIDLVWNADTDADFGGYNVYRREAGTSPQKINSEVVKSPAFRDTNVVPGHEYFYSVSAVDVRGNESSRSEEANETVPAE